MLKILLFSSLWYFWSILVLYVSSQLTTQVTQAAPCSRQGQCLSNSAGCNTRRDGTWGAHASLGGAVRLSMALLSTSWKTEEITGSPRPVWSQHFTGERGMVCSSCPSSWAHLRSHLPVRKLTTRNRGCKEANSILCSFSPSVNIYLSHAKGSSINRALCLPGEQQLQTSSCCGTFLGRSLPLRLGQAVLVGQAEEHLGCDSPGEGEVW